MAKTLLYRLFGFGKIPGTLMTQLRNEGIVLVEEGVRGSVTYRNFRSPHRRSSWRRQWSTASVALTNVRLVALANARPVIDVPLADERVRRLRCTVEEGPTLCVAFDPALFHEDWSGTVEYRIRTPQAERVLEVLRRQGA